MDRSGRKCKASSSSLKEQGQPWGWSPQATEVQGRHADAVWSRANSRSREVQAEKRVAGTKQEMLQTSARLEKLTFTNTDVLYPLC